MFSWMRPLAVQYYKRYRMEFDLRRLIPGPPPVDSYRFLAWRPDLLEFHADVKCRSFQGQLDSVVFPCLGEPHGCLQLMHEITDRDSFLPEATWLAVHDGVHPVDGRLADYCGTIQGLCSTGTLGSIQNVGTVPEHRGRGVGTGLVIRALLGFQEVGMRRAVLEVTAKNDRAVQLYVRLGFRHTRTVYKAVEPPVYS